MSHGLTPHALRKSASCLPLQEKRLAVLGTMKPAAYFLLFENTRGVRRPNATRVCSPLSMPHVSRQVDYLGTEGSGEQVLCRGGWRVFRVRTDRKASSLVSERRWRLRWSRTQSLSGPWKPLLKLPWTCEPILTACLHHYKMKLFEGSNNIFVFNSWYRYSEVLRQCTFNELCE